jgi:hypothetical protein
LSWTSLPAACQKTASSSWFKEGQVRLSKVKQLDFLLMFSGNPCSMPNVVMYTLGGAMMKEVESNVTGVDPITLDFNEPSSLQPLSSQEEESSGMIDC